MDDGKQLTNATTAAAAPAAKPDEAKISKDFFTPKDRLAAMRAASLYAPKAVSEADLMAGPDQAKKHFQLRYNDKVICDFATPGKEMGGMTPKFGCVITRVESPDGTVQTLTPEMDDKDPVKVKYGANDNEVYSEIVSTRLLWSLRAAPPARWQDLKPSIPAAWRCCRSNSSPTGLPRCLRMPPRCPAWNNWASRPAQGITLQSLPA